jgi:hypothetical protein
LLGWEESDKAESWRFVLVAGATFVRAKITERLVSSPDEFPRQGNREGPFSGLIDLRERNPATDFRLIVI